MNIDSFFYFETLARFRNVTHAANAIGLTQQALSAHISRLEDFYGVKLFNREDHFSLTYAGERLFEYCKRINMLSTQIRSEMIDLKSGDRGCLTIGATVKRGFEILPIVFDAFHREYPMVRVDMVVATSEELLQNVIEEKTDFCYIVSETNNPRISSLPVFEEKTLLFITDAALRRYCQKDYAYIIEHKDEPLPITLFASCPFALQSGNNRQRRESNRLFEKNNIIPNIIFTSTNSLCLLDITRRGFCAAFLTASTKVSPDDNLYHFLIQDLSIVTQLKISYLQDHYLSKAALRFIELSQMILPIHFGLISDETGDN